MHTDTPQELCLRCAGCGRTCCQGTAIFITSGDVKRIEAAEPACEFWQMRTLSPDAYETFLAYDEIWGRIFNRSGKVRLLRHNSSGDCCFLGEDGCRLSMDVRPLVCRLYPYDYNSDTLKGVNGHLCPWPERENPALLLALLAMDRGRAEEWRRELYREIREEFPDRG